MLWAGKTFEIALRDRPFQLLTGNAVLRAECVNGIDSDLPVAQVPGTERPAAILRHRSERESIDNSWCEGNLSARTGSSGVFQISRLAGLQKD